MQISSIAQSTVAEQVAAHTAARQAPASSQSAKQAAPSGSQQAAAQSVAAVIQPYSVTPSVLQQATSDGDGLTGVAALNDGDAAAQFAAQQAKSMDFRA